MKPTELTIGLDLGDRKHHLCVLDVSGKIAAEEVIANARKVRAICESQTKSDVEDARMLARLGRADPVLLHPIKHRSEQGQRARLAARRR